MKTSLKIISVILFLSNVVAFATTTAIPPPPKQTTQTDPVQFRNNQEKKQINNPFAITFYEPTYILPFYYSSSHSAIYKNNTPNQQTLQRAEVNFQFSLKAPVWKNILRQKNILYVAYTQLSFWQAYNKSAFFRDTDYQPEIFLANELDKPLSKNWDLQFINVGVVHQSNGRGDSLERSWNRLYVEGIFSRDNLVFNIRPWYIFPDGSLHADNPNISDYLGHGRLLIAYKFRTQTLSFMTYNIENGFKRTAVKLAWSLPLTAKLRGYVQWFSGYGESLLEYNHHSNSIGLGIALSDWI